MRLVVLAALLGGCSATEVAVTVHLPGIEQHQIDASGILRIAVPDDGNYLKSWLIQNSTGTERFIYRSGVSSGMLDIHASWFSEGAGVTLACGEGSVMLHRGGSIPLLIEMHDDNCDGQSPGDMGMSDMGANDMGAGDMGMPDLGQDFGGPVCLFCDNFESGTTSKWIKFNTPGCDEVVNVPAHAGSWAAQFNLVEGDGGFQQAQMFENMTNRDLWIRAWYRGNTNLFGFTGTQPFVRVFDSSDNGMTLGYDNYGTIEEVYSPTGSMAETTSAWSKGNAYQCVEWHVDTLHGNADIYVNDEVTPQAHTTFTPYVPAYVNFGLESYTDESWMVDDVYIAASRVGCSTPTP
jgi:hypothetical protein